MSFAQDDVLAQPLSEEEEEGIVETVKLGGEGLEQQAAGAVQEAEPQVAMPQSLEDVGNEEDVKISPPSSSLPPAPIKDDKQTANPSLLDPSRVAYAATRRNARTMSLSVPAPRGMITDRDGLAMAYSEVAYQPAIRFGQLKNGSDEQVLAIAKRVIDRYTELDLRMIARTENYILNHYRYRRWLPLPVGMVLRKDDADALLAKVGVLPYSELLPVYIRKYPEAGLASHILGYTGTQAKLPIGPINHNDPIFERQEGRSGLEKSFNQQLTGNDGIWRLMFNERGDKILDELQQTPRPGGTLVTTLNLPWQKAAEEALRDHTNGRGAFVMLDCHTGEIVVMATIPNFDPNQFIPFITQKDYDALRENPAKPLVSRAYAGVYPPASTFKPVTIAAALRHGVIAEDTYIFCPYSVRIGGHEFRNHSRFTGSINCVTALVLSNNPFMYITAASATNSLGAARLCAMARRMGYGQRSGIPLPDKAGNVPDENWMFRSYGRGFMQGDAANMAIGQGPLLATPLQVAHSVAAIANGRYLPKLQLVRQMLDRDGNVVYQFSPEVQSNLSDMASSFAVVRRGMQGVVNGGTGRRAALSYTSNAGKTGTAQWGRASDDCRLAWFAGFMPADKPRYAYVALYEGEPHQRIAGGRMAAAIVKTFFESISTSMKLVLEGGDAQIDIDLGELEGEDLGAEDVSEQDAALIQEKIKQEQELRKAQERRNRTKGWRSGRSRRR